MPAEGPGSILGGLPVIAVVTGGKDPDTPNGPGDYWTEVVSIHWMKRDGSKGKEIPDHIRDRAEKYDYGFCDLTQQVFDHVAYEQWEREQHEPVTLTSGAQGIAARSDETLKAAQPEGQEPGGGTPCAHPHPQSRNPLT